MDWKDRSKEILKDFCLDLTLKYYSHTQEKIYQENFCFFPVKGEILKYLFLVFNFMGVLSTDDTWKRSVYVGFLILIVWCRAGFYANWILFFSYLASPQNTESEQFALLLLEMIFHFTVSKSLILYFLSIVCRACLYQRLCACAYESILCIIAFVILTKDTKSLWAMQHLYINLTTEMQKMLKIQNSAYFIIDKTGKVLEQNDTASSINCFKSASCPSDINSIFPEDLCDYFFTVTKTPKNFPKGEKEFLLFHSQENSPRNLKSFSSVSTKIIPITIKSKEIFLLILNNISHQITERKLLLDLAKKSQKFFEGVYKKYLTLYSLQHPPGELEISLIKSCIFEQIGLKGLINFLIGASDVNFSDFNVKTEVINTVQTVWTSLNIQDTKIHVLVDKVIPVVRTDLSKHNLILRLMLEFIMKYFDKNLNLIINVTRSSLEKIQYKFKFYSNTLTQQEINKLFSWDYCMNSTEKARILICLHLIQVLNGKIEEIKVNSELGKVNIRLSFVFNIGAPQKCSKFSLISIPKDAVIFSWPACVLPKRTNLSITKLRKMIHTNTVVHTTAYSPTPHALSCEL